MSVAQRQLHEKLMHGPRGAIVGPFKVWLHQPALANVADEFGKYCRFNTTLDRRIAELTIMQVARHTNAKFEWNHHYPYALQAGISESQLAALQNGEPINGLDERTRAAYVVVSEMLVTHSVSNESYQIAAQVLGDETLVDLVGVVGYYLFVSLTINVFNVVD
ncbi:MAG: carboxymuconolactone decarboxylase family protein [Burkholderiaceae bacterium]